MPSALLDTGSAHPESEADSDEEEINGEVDTCVTEHTFIVIEIRTFIVVDLQMELRCRQTLPWIALSFPRGTKMLMMADLLVEAGHILITLLHVPR